MGGVAPVSVLQTSTLSRAVWGATLLGDPRLVLRLLGGRPTRLARAGLRTLGARHLVQAGVTAVRPTPVVLVVGVGLDALHAISALALAAIDPASIRIGLTDAGIASTWISLDLRAFLRLRDRTAHRRRVQARRLVKRRRERRLSEARREPYGPAGRLSRRRVG